jgi:hypothetical protein
MINNIAPALPNHPSSSNLSACDSLNVCTAMNEMIDQTKTSKMIQFFCRHLVALGVTFEHKDSRKSQPAPQFVAYAGTLIKIHNAVCFLTAGHILEDLEKALKSDQIEIKGAVLADTFGLQCASNHPIPFDLRNAKLFYIDDDREGLDFGVIILEPYYVRLLALNGMVALEEKNWIHQHDVKFETYLMLGLPEEFTSISVNGDASVNPTILKVEGLDCPPSNAAQTQYPRFVGQLPEGLPLKSVKGMSGGPIFGFSHRPELRYWVVALQSSWVPERRIVYGCPLPLLASLMTKWADQPAVERSEIDQICADKS